MSSIFLVVVGAYDLGCNAASAFLCSKHIDKNYRMYYHICKRGGAMELRLKKQAQKYLDSVDEPTRKKLYKALDQLAQLKGDIRPLKGTQNHYRFKIQHDRILFEWNKGEIVITVIEINTRTNIKY